jgi:hypothetical protein
VKRVPRSILPVTATLLLGFAACGEDGTQLGGAPGQDGGAPNDATSPTDAFGDRTRPPDEGGPPAVARVAVASEVTVPRVDIQQLMFAAGEMQTSGEPFAQHFAGRNLNFYDRTYLPTDQYLVKNGEEQKPVTDLFGFSTAVESYEYSKYHMNMVVQQTGAGISLANGPVVAKLAGATAQDKLIARVQALLQTAGTDIAGYAIVPPPQNNPKNLLGFAGLEPSFLPYRSFLPDMTPLTTVVLSCALNGGYGGVPTVGGMIPAYECTYNSLRLNDLAAQTDRTIVPGAVGLAVWKQAIWAIDFTSRIHDVGSNPVNAVADADLPNVGKPGNTVIATDPPGSGVGTFIGSNPLEGMWGLVMLANIDNAAEWLVSSATTADGTTLGGFTDKLTATQYDYTSPLRWFPAASSATVDLTQAFPPLQSLAITDAKSRSEDLAGLLLGHSLFFGMTDARNAGLGQTVGERCVWDGDPFAADDGIANGEETAHDRALAVIRVAFVNLDRMHADPTLGVISDTATVTGTTVSRSSAVTTTSLAHVLIGLRQTLLSLNGAISQYGSADPDPSADAKGILNTALIHPLPSGTQPTFSARVRSVFVTNATFVRDVLSKADGTVANGATIKNGVATANTDPTTLESQAAAIRAMTEGFLLTGDETFRDRGRAILHKLATSFYVPAMRMYRGVSGGADEVRMTAERFAWLQSAMRETYKVLSIPGDPDLGRDVLEDRIARINKLFLNGWDDLNGDTIVDKDQGECLTGRLQLAEQSLTGELGRDALSRPVDDRDSDCVLELAHAKQASVLAGEVYFHKK